MEFSSPEPLISIFPFQFLLIGEGQQECPTGELGREKRYLGLAWHKHSGRFWIRPCLHQASGPLSPGPQPSTARELQKLGGLCILGLLPLFCFLDRSSLSQARTPHFRSLCSSNTIPQVFPDHLVSATSSLPPHSPCFSSSALFFCRAHLMSEHLGNILLMGYPPPL